MKIRDLIQRITPAEALVAALELVALAAFLWLAFHYPQEAQFP